MYASMTLAEHCLIITIALATIRKPNEINQVCLQMKFPDSSALSFRSTADLESSSKEFPFCKTPKPTAGDSVEISPPLPYPTCLATTEPKFGKAEPCRSSMISEYLLDPEECCAAWNLGFTCDPAHCSFNHACFWDSCASLFHADHRAIQHTQL